MKINQKQWLIIVALLITVGVAIFSIGHTIFQNKEGSYTMENQSYALSDIDRMQINTDSPSVVITPVSGDQINLTWQTGEYVEYQAQLTDGKLTIEYNISTNWLKALLLGPLVQNEYVLEVELPDDYTGSLVIHTASGKIIANTAAALEECSLTTASGSIDAVNIDSREGVELRSTSGGISADSVHAANDIRIQTVSGSAKLTKSAANDGISIQTTSGGIDAAELNAADRFHAKTTSGRIELSQIQCGGDVTLDSSSGTLKPSDVVCESFAAKTVSGSIKFQGLTADAIEMKSTSGSINGTVNGKRDEFDIQVQTVSGRSNLQSTAAGKDKTLKLDTVSGSIDVQFTNGNGNESV